MPYLAGLILCETYKFPNLSKATPEIPVNSVAFTSDSIIFFTNVPVSVYSAIEKVKSCLPVPPFGTIKFPFEFIARSLTPLVLIIVEIC